MLSKRNVKEYTYIIIMLYASVILEVEIQLMLTNVTFIGIQYWFWSLPKFIVRWTFSKLPVGYRTCEAIFPFWEIHYDLVHIKPWYHCKSSVKKKGQHRLDTIENVEEIIYKCLKFERVLYISSMTSILSQLQCRRGKTRKRNMHNCIQFDNKFLSVHLLPIDCVVAGSSW